MRLSGTRPYFKMFRLTLSVVALSSLGSAQTNSAQILSTGDPASVQQIQTLIEEYKSRVARTTRFVVRVFSAP